MDPRDFTKVFCPPPAEATKNPPPSTNYPAGDLRERVADNERQAGKRYHYYRQAKEQAKSKDPKVRKKADWWAEGAGRWPKVLGRALNFLKQGFDFEKYIKAEHAAIDPSDLYEPLHTAILMQDGLVVDELLYPDDGREGADPNAPTRKGRSPMMLAVAAGDVGILRMLIAAGGADPTLARLGVLPPEPEPEDHTEHQTWAVGQIWGAAEAGAVAAAWAAEHKPGEGWEWSGTWRAEKGISLCDFHRTVKRPLSAEIRPASKGVGFGAPAVQWVNPDFSTEKAEENRCGREQHSAPYLAYISRLPSARAQHLCCHFILLR
jgi:hypothetical protein